MKCIHKLYLEIKRSKMPQVKSDELSLILKKLKDDNINYSLEKVSLSTLTPSQENFYNYKKENFIKLIKQGKKFDPIFVSSDNYILDGHHRILAYKELYGNKYTNDIIRIDKPKADALKILEKYTEGK